MGPFPSIYNVFWGQQQFEALPWAPEYEEQQKEILELLNFLLYMECFEVQNCLKFCLGQIL